MGVDFVAACTPTFTKGWDTGLANVQTADLFTDMPTETSRTYRAASGGGPSVQPGETVFLRPSGPEMAVFRGRARVGTIRNLPSSVTERIARQGCGIATATVTKVYKRSGDFEIRMN